MALLTTKCRSKTILNSAQASPVTQVGLGHLLDLSNDGVNDLRQYSGFGLTDPPHRFLAAAWNFLDGDLLDGGRVPLIKITPPVY